jgi:hypothetical protein
MGDDMNRTVLLDPADTVILLLDHQNGLFQTVKDVPLSELRTNTVVLAKVAKLANIPVITTASVPDCPNGPLMHELQAVAPDAQPGFNRKYQADCRCPSSSQCEGNPHSGRPLSSSGVTMPLQQTLNLV